MRIRFGCGLDSRIYGISPVGGGTSALCVCLSCGSVTIPTELIQQFFTIHLMTAAVHNIAMNEGFICERDGKDADRSGWDLIVGSSSACEWCNFKKKSSPPKKKSRSGPQEKTYYTANSE